MDDQLVHIEFLAFLFELRSAVCSALSSSASEVGVYLEIYDILFLGSGEGITEVGIALSRAYILTDRKSESMTADIDGSRLYDSCTLDQLGASHGERIEQRGYPGDLRRPSDSPPDIPAEGGREGDAHPISDVGLADQCF